MRRGTTRMLTCTCEGWNLKSWDIVVVTIRQGKSHVDISSGFGFSDDGQSLYLPFTQLQTLGMKPGRAYIQIRVASKDGKSADATPIKRILIGDVLNESYMGDDAE